MSKNKFFVICLLVISPLSWASAEVALQITPQRGSINDVFTLEVVLSGDDFDAEPRFAPDEDFSLDPLGTSVSRQFINGMSSSSKTLTFRFIPKKPLKPGTYKSPAGQLEGGSSRPLPQASFIVEKQDDPALTEQGQDVAVVQVLSDENPYIGQQILYRTNIATRLNLESASLEDVNLHGVIRESFGDKSEIQRVVNSVPPTRVYSILEALFPNEAGELEVPGRALTAKVRIPSRRARARDPFDMFFGSPITQLRNYDVVTKRYFAPGVKLSVKPLPDLPSDSDGYVPVGTVNSSVDVSTRHVLEGESISMKIVVDGNANLRPLELGKPDQEDESNFKLYFDKPEIETSLDKGQIFFTKTFSIAAIPLKSGTLSLPRFSFYSFDPTTGQYTKHLTKPVVVQVSPNPNAGRLVIAGQASDSQASDSHKLQVQQLAESLLPINATHSAFAPKSQISKRFLWACLVLLSLSGLMTFRYLRSRRLLLGDPKRARSISACRRALQALEQSTPHDAQSLLNILNTYLIDRLSLNEQALTPKIAGRSLTAAFRLKSDSESPKTKIVEDSVAFMSTLERECFAGGGNNLLPANDLAMRTKVVIETIERAL